MKLLFILLPLFSITSCFAPQVSKVATAEDHRIPAAYSDLLTVEQKIINVYRQNVPAVVNVSNIKVADSFFYGRVEVPQGAGTGFVWDKDGHIVTNYHVVMNGNSFVVTFHNDEKQYKAKVVGVAPHKDVAVLKLEEKPKFPLVPVKPGSSKELQVGQMALAIGNPFGLDHSLSQGIISALGRKIDGVGGFKISDMIQTDAAINQGNSGGPLLNSAGEVIGMNTMIFSTSGSSAGLGFAVPIDTVSRIVPDLIQHGKVIRPGLGIGILDEQIRQRYVGDKGAVISYIDENGAASKAGLKGVEKDRYGRIYLGDVILTIDGAEVNNRDDVFQILDNKKIGDVIKVEYLREGKKKKTEIKLQEL